MKKLKLIILILVIASMLFILTGCTSSETEVKETKRFVRVNYIDDVILYYDNITKVQYISYNNVHGGTALTVLVDAEGKPLLYEGE